VISDIQRSKPYNTKNLNNLTDACPIQSKLLAHQHQTFVVFTYFQILQHSIAELYKNVSY